MIVFVAASVDSPDECSLSARFLSLLLLLTRESFGVVPVTVVVGRAVAVVVAGGATVPVEGMLL